MPKNTLAHELVTEVITGRMPSLPLAQAVRDQNEDFA